MSGRDMHLSAERMQAFLEGDLPQAERSRVEEHLAGCARCSAELDAWRVLFTDLAALPVPEPASGFADRVMTRVRIPAENPSWLASLLPSRTKFSKNRHLTGDVLQDLADGMLPARRATKAHAHLAACTTCADELEAWQGVMATLARVPRLGPGEAFADRVMAAVRTSAKSPANVVTRPATVPAVATPWSRALVLARRLAVRMVPRTRRAWAALSGIAVTPAAIFALVLWVVFSHPTLTPQALASYALWQLSDLLAAGWNGLLVSGTQAASTVGVESLIDSLTQSPLLIAVAALAYSAVAAVALRVLYKNLITHRRYARVSPR